MLHEMEIFQYLGDENICPSRRDEIMSLGFMLMHLALGYKAPWENEYRCPKLDYVNSLSKGDMRMVELKPFEDLVIYSSNLNYKEAPDYELLRMNLRNYVRDNGVVLDGTFDWDSHLSVNETGNIVLKRSDVEEDEYSLL